jgi:hypothetical protein
MVLVWRPNYGNLIISFIESTNLCILGIIFICFVIWIFSTWGLELVVIFKTSAGLWKIDFLWKTYCIFCVGGFTGFPSIERSLISSFGFIFNFLDYDVYLHDLIVVVVSFKTSPISSKTESECSSYLSIRTRLSIVFLCLVVVVQYRVYYRKWSLSYHFKVFFTGSTDATSGCFAHVHVLLQRLDFGGPI